MNNLFYNLQLNIFKMEIKEFIENLAEALEIDDASELNGNTVFEDIEEWSSLGVLEVITMISNEYDVILSPKEMRTVKTIEELVNLIKSKA